MLPAYEITRGEAGSWKVDRDMAAGGTPRNPHAPTWGRLAVRVPVRGTCLVLLHTGVHGQIKTQVVNAQPMPSPPTTFLGMLAPKTPLAW